jgi:hypothetical protein
MEVKRILQAEQLTALRKSGVLQESEYAYIAGDLIVAEDVKSSAKRVLGKASDILQEGKKRVLLG